MIKKSIMGNILNTSTLLFLSFPVKNWNQTPVHSSKYIQCQGPTAIPTLSGYLFYVTK